MDQNKLLRYRQYKIAQGLWLQQKINEVTFRGRSWEELSLIHYKQYLEVCGVKNTEALDAISNYIDAIRFDQHKDHAVMVENIDDIMDELHFQISLS